MNDTQAGPRPSPAHIAEATKRSGLIWVEVPGRGDPRPLWHVWLDAGAGGAAYVLTGPGEQSLPELADADQVTVIVPDRESGGRLSWQAAVARVPPGGAEWDAVLRPLLAGRLNAAPGPEGGSPAPRWARECEVFRLEPAPARTREAGQGGPSGRILPAR